MSHETATWLNTMTLIGFTGQRGHAWHYRASKQGAEPNHYPGAIPVEDVRRRLFGWQVLEGTVTSMATVLGDDGVETVTISDPDRKAMLRPPGALGSDDPGAILGIFRSGYAGHDYGRWLLEQVAEILDDELAIGSAGLLRGGALAWVSVEVPETITTPEGVAFRPHLLATTSFDGSVATTYGRKVQLVVCDNTHAVAMREAGQQLKVRHSRHSHVKLADAREALALVHTIADDFAAEVARLTAVKVSDGDWARFLNELAPLPDASGRARSMAETKRERLARLWDHDTRVAPWRGTAFGVMQAMSTYAHHEGTVRRVSRAERNMLRAVTGESDALDRRSVEAILQIAA
jgi:phage/plasmid-like protein (TIGR03299 family)